MYLEFHYNNKTIVWSIQDVDDFELKLGLIDDKSSDGEDIQTKIKQFLKASEVCLANS